jgi:pimeloyl-ACP methyl ester carboxylesterase
MANSQTSGFLKLGSQALYGTVFAAAPPASGGVVLFDAFGEEKKCAFRVMVRLARALAARGFTTFHFDHSGSGESAGDQARVAWDDWLAEAEAAAAFLQQQAGTDRWLAVGVRLGAFAALHAAQRARARAVTLVEPILAGEECLRDLERRQRIKQAVVGSAAAEEEGSAQRWARGEAVDLGGFEVGPRLAAGLGQESLSARLAQLQGDCPVQLLRVSGSPSLPPAWKPLAERAQALAPGRAAVVRDKPFWGQLEYYESDLVLNEVVAFAEATLGQAGAAAAAEGSRP